MTRKSKFRSFSVYITVFIISFFQACHDSSKEDHRRSDAEKGVVISLRFMETPSGSWGYEILLDKKVYIHQEYLPALEGQQPFSSKKEARKVGRAVLEKNTD